MSNPPDGKYRKSYNGEAVYTADRVLITEGLRVWTNNLDQGVLTLERAEYEWNGSEDRYVLWFDVAVHTNYRGEPVTQRNMQSDDRVATRHPVTRKAA